MTRFSRRRLLAAGSALAVAGAAAPMAVSATDAIADDDAPRLAADALFGRVIAVSADGIALDVGGTRAQLVAGTDARLYAGGNGRVSTLQEFVVGDRLVAEGAWAPDHSVFVASAVGSVFEPVELTVQSLDGNDAITAGSGRRYRLGAAPDRGRVSPVAGKAYSGWTWTDPRSGAPTLVLLDQ